MELIVQTMQKRFELQIKEEVASREEAQKDLFEQEKQEFLKAIQENMLILDSMLKEYATKAKFHLGHKQKLTVSPHANLTPPANDVIGMNESDEISSSQGGLQPYGNAGDTQFT